jgi:hypothetical protein
MATKPLAQAAARGTFFERHTWKVLLGISLIIGLFGLLDMTGGAADLQNGETVLMHSYTGMSWAEMQAAQPEAAYMIDRIFRTNGASLFTLALLSGAVCVFGFRRGERWAWYALWAFPIWFALTIVLVWTGIRYAAYGTPVPVISGSLFLVVWVGLLALTAARFHRSGSDSAPRVG